MSAAFNWNSDNYRLSQETSKLFLTQLPRLTLLLRLSLTLCTIAVNKVKLLLLFLCYSKEKGEADFSTQHPAEPKPQGELLVELQLSIYFFSQVVVLVSLNFKKPQKTPLPTLIAHSHIFAIGVSIIKS